MEKKKNTIKFNHVGSGHARIQRGTPWTGGPDPLENHKNIGFLSNTGLDSLKSQTSIQCSAIVSPPAKRHFNAFRRRADNGPLLVIF